jgi:hypothetical protein
VTAAVLGCGSSPPERAAGDAGEQYPEDAGEQQPENCDKPAELLSNAAGALACRYDLGAVPYDATLIADAQDRLFVAPGPGESLYRSEDLGKTWTLLDPTNQGGPTRSGQYLHPWVYRAPRSGRIFFNIYDLSHGESVCGGPSGTSLWFSDDHGDSWQHESVGCGSHDWAKVISGPAATDAQRAALKKSGYPQMLYLCATGPTLITGPDHMCFSSTDGGESFQAIKQPPVDRSDNPSLLVPIAFPQAGVVDSKGTVYKTHASAQGVTLKLSHDGGDTWESAFVSDSVLAGGYGNFLSSNIAIDSKDRLYVVWVDDRDYRAYLSTSADHGKSWSARVQVSVDEVKHAAYPNLSVFEPGHVAIAYYGSAAATGSGDGYSSSDGRDYDTYLTATENALKDAPIFTTARVNVAGEPVVQGWTFNASEYLGPPARTSDGSVWAAFVNNGKGLVGRLRL